jgi:peptide-methionine (S)-S-oxide reductase
MIIRFLLILLVANMANANEKYEKATFAGGCFWCIESDFEKVGGVISVTSGYIGGDEKTATYEQVSSGSTKHVEAVEIVYDPTIVNYEKLINKFWRTTDPTVKNRQFCDVGPQYRNEVFYHNEDQKVTAEKTKQEINDSGILKDRSIISNITEASAFYEAEGYHQNYYKKNPVRYKFYRYSCGRDKRVKELWGDD